jgi:hypothetical protein
MQAQSKLKQGFLNLILKNYSEVYREKQKTQNSQHHIEEEQS